MKITIKSHFNPIYEYLPEGKPHKIPATTTFFLRVSYGFPSCDPRGAAQLRLAPKLRQGSLRQFPQAVDGMGPNTGLWWFMVVYSDLWWFIVIYSAWL